VELGNGDGQGEGGCVEGNDDSTSGNETNGDNAGGNTTDVDSGDKHLTPPTPVVQYPTTLILVIRHLMTPTSAM
jgi:hypothetical protein